MEQPYLSHRGEKIFFFPNFVSTSRIACEMVCNITHTCKNRMDLQVVDKMRRFFKIYFSISKKKLNFRLRDHITTKL